jgi:hypothetical protein
VSLKPLYLDHGPRWRVRLDGPALRVDGGGRAPGRYPLRRLARVVSASDVDWSTEALLGCLQAGVPIVFRSQRGDEQGWCFGPRRRETTLAGLLREALSRPEWDARFDAWRAAVARREMLHALERCGLRTSEAPVAREAEAKLCNAIALRYGIAPAAYVRALRSCAGAWIAERLAGAIGDPELIAWPREGLHLGHEFAALAAWHLHVEHCRCGAVALRDETPNRWAAMLLERAGARLDAKLGEILGDFERSLREWVL